METGGSNKNIGEPDLNQTSQLTKQGHGSLNNNSHLEVFTALPSDVTNNEVKACADVSSPGKSFHEPANTNNNTPSACETVSTNFESHTSVENGKDNFPDSSMQKDEQGHVAGEANQGSEIQNPPVQVMERPGELGTSPEYIFPSHVFSKSIANSPVEWSTASNESLFSIYMGNTSFSNELVCFKSCELDKPGDVCMHDQSNASPAQQSPAPVNKFNVISQKAYEQQLLHEQSSKAAEAKAAETMREVIMESSRTTKNIGKGDDNVSNSLSQSEDDANSHMLQSSEGRDKSVPSKGVGEIQNQQNQSEETKTPNAADQAPKSTTNAPNKWLNCFSCCTFCI